jgi:very-short-patch-repair endonuclease
VAGLFRADFYIPEVRLVLEINGVNHFYPYTRKPIQYTQFKTKLLRGNQKHCSEAQGTYNVVNLNTHMLEGLKRTPENLRILLEKIINDYRSKL